MRSFISGGIAPGVSLVYCATKIQQILRYSGVLKVFVELTSPWKSINGRESGKLPQTRAHGPPTSICGIWFSTEETISHRGRSPWCPRIHCRSNKPMWTLNLLPRCCHTQLGHKLVETGSCWREPGRSELLPPHKFRVRNAELPFTLALPLLIKKRNGCVGIFS